MLEICHFHYVITLSGLLSLKGSSLCSVQAAFRFRRSNQFLSLTEIIGIIIFQIFVLCLLYVFGVISSVLNLVSIHCSSPAFDFLQATYLPLLFLPLELQGNNVQFE